LSKAKPWVIPAGLALIGGTILYQSIHQFQRGLVEVLVATHPISQDDVLTILNPNRFKKKIFRWERYPPPKLVS
jgi:hypothetical protein